jgi:dTDP-4-dehydrorhamnose reductase
MTKVLILGGSGMLGHKAYQVFSKEMETYVTFRNYDERIRSLKLFKDHSVIQNVDAFRFDSVEMAISRVRPDFVLNCVGIIKQRKEAKNARESIYINALFPHLLAECCEQAGSKLLHVSTDCVFSGDKGMYREEDISDAEDLYGRTKYLGELNDSNSLTLRTSIIGHELSEGISLIDWFLSQKGEVVNGYTNAIYSGFPTVVFSRELLRIIKNFPTLKGLYQVSSEKISKFQLLSIVRDIYQVPVELKPYGDIRCDRSLDSTRYRERTQLQLLSWENMIHMMHEDYKTTEQWSKQ